jgi:hypothetical protein
LPTLSLDSTPRIPDSRVISQRSRRRTHEAEVYENAPALDVLLFDGMTVAAVGFSPRSNAK